MQNFSENIINDNFKVEYDNQFQRVCDPYKMDPHKVRISHFKQGWIYDPDAQAGFKVQRHVAKSKYNNYKRRLRDREGWENYRRPPQIIYEEVKERNRIVIVKVTIYMRVAGIKLPEYTIEKVSRVPKGATLIRLPKEDPKKNRVTDIAVTDPSEETDDKTSVSPRMFTPHMGKEIARLRNELELTQVELARIVCVDSNYIKNVELGGLISFNPEDVIVRKLARALGVPSIKYQE